MQPMVKLSDINKLAQTIAGEFQPHRIILFGSAVTGQMTRDSDIDLLLTDIVMPGLDGIALALKVAKDFPRVRILLMTGYAAERQRAHNLDALIHRVIAKPFSLQEICRVVKEVLADWPSSPDAGNGGAALR